MKSLVSHFHACPFCGSDDLIARSSEDIDDAVLHAIWCGHCDAAGPIVEGDEDRAWTAWNLRTDIERSWLDPARRGTSHPLPEDAYLRELARGCPFCGHRILKCDSLEDGPSSIACLTCEASAVADGAGALAAIEVWNSRR